MQLRFFMLKHGNHLTIQLRYPALMRGRADLTGTPAWPPVSSADTELTGRQTVVYPQVQRTRKTLCIRHDTQSIGRSVWLINIGQASCTAIGTAYRLAICGDHKHDNSKINAMWAEYIREIDVCQVRE
jgi:hypothetical protein